MRSNRDLVIKVSTVCGKYRFLLCNAPHLFHTALKTHTLITRTHRAFSFLQLFGQSLCFTNLLSSCHQHEERVELRYVAPEAFISVEAMALGECRALVSNRTNEDETLGSGTLLIRRILFNEDKPFTSVTRLHDGEGCSPSNNTLQDHPGAPEITTRAQNDFTPHALNFLRQSDGIPSSVFLGTSFDQEHESLDEVSCKPSDLSCMGIIVQALAANTTTPSPMGDNTVPPPSTQTSDAIDIIQRRLDALHRIFYNKMAIVDARDQAVRARLKRFWCQDLLSITTGDVIAAQNIARLCHLPTEELGVEHDELQALLQCDASTLVENKFILDPNSMKVTPLDYFCRCSINSVSQTLSDSDRQNLFNGAQSDTVEVQCVYCKRTQKIPSSKQPSQPPK